MTVDLLNAITAMITALGYPVFISLAMFASVVVVFRLYVGSNKDLVAATQSHQAKMEEVATANRVALDANTASNKSLVDTIQLQFPNLCRAERLVRPQT